MYSYLDNPSNGKREYYVRGMLLISLKKKSIFVKNWRDGWVVGKEEAIPKEVREAIPF